MSKITTEKYETVKMERLKHYLESNDERGRPKFYEIFVDNLKAVEKTSDPACFDDYLMYMNDDTRVIKVLIYTSTENCPRNDKFIYTVVNPEEEKRRTEKTSQELNGLELQSRIDAAIQTERERNNMEKLKSELGEVKQKLEEAEEYIETLEEELEDQKSKKHSWREVQLGNVLSVFLEETAKRNPSLIKNIPVLGALSGLHSESNTATNTAASDTEASFTKKPNDSNDEKVIAGKLAFVTEMEAAFSEAELVKVIETIRGMAQDHSLIDTLHDLIYTTNEK
jgi:hypothetical protein